MARDGIEAMLAGKPHVVAGALRNRVLAEVSTHLPDRVASRMQARMAKPGSGS